jgi:hypothetical protein
MVTPSLHFDILPEEQHHLFEQLAEQPWIHAFYLAGGTALALYLGHRQSLDFDFFTPDEFQNRTIRERLQNIGRFELFSEAEYTIHGLLNDVRISFFRYAYPLLHELYQYHYLRIADIFDIAVMKLEAISGRGSKKDFIDFYSILPLFTLTDLFAGYEQKYGIAVSNHYHLLKSLVYFDDAESDPMPTMFVKVTWAEVKSTIVQSIKELQLL